MGLTADRRRGRWRDRDNVRAPCAVVRRRGHPDRRRDRRGASAASSALRGSRGRRPTAAGVGARGHIKRGGRLRAPSLPATNQAADHESAAWQLRPAGRSDTWKCRAGPPATPSRLHPTPRAIHRRGSCAARVAITRTERRGHARAGRRFGHGHREGTAQRRSRMDQSAGRSAANTSGCIVARCARRSIAT
jgi:hypothetical protein